MEKSGNLFSFFASLKPLLQRHCVSFLDISTGKGSKTFGHLPMSELILNRWLGIKEDLVDKVDLIVF